MVSSWAAPPAPAAAYRPSTAAMPAPIAAPTRHPLRSVDLIRKSDIGPSCNATKNPSPNPMIAAFMVPDARSWRKGSRQIQQGSPQLDGDGFRGLHQRGAHAMAAMVRAGHELGDLGSVRLVGCEVEEQGHGADQDARLPRAENHALIPSLCGQRISPVRLRHNRVERVHEAHRAAIRYNLHEHVAQLCERPR